MSMTGSNHVKQMDDALNTNLFPVMHALGT